MNTQPAEIQEGLVPLEAEGKEVADKRPRLTPKCSGDMSQVRTWGWSVLEVTGDLSIERFARGVVQAGARLPREEDRAGAGEEETGMGTTLGVNLAVERGKRSQDLEWEVGSYFKMGEFRKQV